MCRSSSTKGRRSSAGIYTAHLVVLALARSVTSTRSPCLPTIGAHEWGGGCTSIRGARLAGRSSSSSRINSSSSSSSTHCVAGPSRSTWEKVGGVAGPS
eukprot:87855-Chlamydomonas_euryale.AAC.1